MIVTKLIGGLGNQLFQYAVARQLANIHKTQVSLDIHQFETYKLHKYSLQPLNISASLIGKNQVEKYTQPGIMEKLIGKIRQRPPTKPKSFIKEKHYHFDPNILKCSDNIYLDGYWQSEKYFKNISHILKEELTPINEQTGKDKLIADQILNSESVSIHLRRGDYITNSITNQYHGICTTKYFLKCIENITRKVSNPNFFVFSDDPDWCRKNLKIQYPITIINHNSADNNYQDLRLMSQCNHNIIANSSFSWWGAWLNNNPEKIVYAPKNWFNNPKNDTSDLIPSDWSTI